MNKEVLIIEKESYKLIISSSAIKGSDLVVVRIDSSDSIKNISINLKDVDKIINHLQSIKDSQNKEEEILEDNTDFPQHNYIDTNGMFGEESKLSSGWQLCPKCNSRPTIIKCDVCKGKKIINIETGLPPVHQT